MNNNQPNKSQKIIADVYLNHRFKMCTKKYW